MRVSTTQAFDKFKIKTHLGESLVLFFLFLSMMFAWQSCQEAPTPAEKIYLDTLYYKLKGNEKALNIDEQALVDRKEIIRSIWIPSLKDTMPDIRVRMEDELRGMLTAYDYYLDRQLLFKSSTRLLLEDWEKFKSQTDAEEISREEFKEQYKSLNEKVMKNTNEIELMAKPVYELEPMWLRFKRMMDIRGVSSSLTDSSGN